MDAAEALLELSSLQRAFAIGIIFHHGGGEHLTESDGEPFGNGGDVFHNRHEFSLAVGSDWWLVARDLENHHKGHEGSTKVRGQRVFLVLRFNPGRRQYRPNTKIDPDSFKQIQSCWKVVRGGKPPTSN